MIKNLIFKTDILIKNNINIFSLFMIWTLKLWSFSLILKWIIIINLINRNCFNYIKWLIIFCLMKLNFIIACLSNILISLNANKKA